MPSGFRGNAAEVYLAMVNGALNSAAASHSQQAPAGSAAQNMTSPHDVSSAHSGGNVTGVGTSNNIVVSSAEYSSILSRIDSIDDDMGRTLHQLSVRVEELCRGDFVLPHTVRQCNIMTGMLKNALGEYRSLTDEALISMRRFTNDILSIG